MFQIVPEGPHDGPAIDSLLDTSFGADRRRKISYRYRVGLEPLTELGLVAREGERLVGTIRYWPMQLDGTPVLLLGPIAIDPEHRGQGIARALMEQSMAKAAALGWRHVFLVGDAEYYHQRGFSSCPANVRMPGENPARLQVALLKDGALPAEGGVLRHALPGSRLTALQRSQIGEERLADGGETLVGGHAGLDLVEAGGEGRRHAGHAGDLVHAADEGADGEDDRLRLWQAAQGLPFHPQPQKLAGILRV